MLTGRAVVNKVKLLDSGKRNTYHHLLKDSQVSGLPLKTNWVGEACRIQPIVKFSITKYFDSGAIKTGQMIIREIWKRKLLNLLLKNKKEKGNV